MSGINVVDPLTNPRMIAGYRTAINFPERANVGDFYEPGNGQRYEYLEDADAKHYRHWVSVGPAVAGIVYDFRIGLTQTGTVVDLDPARVAEIGGFLEVPADGLTYGRQNIGGTGSWVVAAGSSYIWSVGLVENPVGTISLLPASAAELGGVTVGPRSAIQALNLDPLGALTGPLATDLLAGSILEPLPDGLQYARTRSTLGVSTWAPVVSGGAFVGDDPPAPPNTQGQFWFESDSGKLFVFFIDAGGPPGQWVQCGGV